jgi:hypothetical protein
VHLVKKFPEFYGTRRFITALTSFRQPSLSWASPIQSKYTQTTSWRSILIFQTMWLEAVEVAPRSIMEYSPHSGPEQCKYLCIYILFYGLKFMASLNFQCVFKAIIFKRLGHTLKQHNIARWDPQFIPSFLQTQAEWRHSLHGQQALNKHLTI